MWASQYLPSVRFGLPGYGQGLFGFHGIGGSSYIVITAKEKERY
jgi:hypothetical protein